MKHELKCWPVYFRAIKSGAKTFEWRSTADRKFAAGDTLRLREWDAGSCDYTGEEIDAAVTYVLQGPHFGVPPGFAVLAIKPIPRTR